MQLGTYDKPLDKDPGAFVIVSNVDEVNGNGFTFGVRNQM
jgi:hypothetical protein